MIVRAALTCVAAACLLLATVACGTSEDPDPAASCSAAVPSDRGQFQGCFGGALSGDVRTVAEPAQCPTEPFVAGEDYDQRFVVMVGPDITQVEINYRDDVVPGQPAALSTTGNVLVNVSQREKQLNWSNVISGALGEATVDPDGSGRLRVTLPQRDYSSGAAVPNAPKLELNAAWRCA